MQLVGSGLAASVAPLTLDKQTAVLTLFYQLLPPLFFGLGPQWMRLQTVESDVATNITSFSLLMDSILPPIWNDTDDTFPNVSALDSQPQLYHLSCLLCCYPVAAQKVTPCL
jgi:hypothetical protein